MAAQKPLQLINGLPEEVPAVQVSSGPTDAGKVVALNDNGDIDESMLPPGVGLNIDVLPSFENLAAGDWVNTFDDAGTVKVRKADNSNGRQADGFVREAVTAPANATVYGPGELNDQLSGLTGGTRYFLGTVGGETDTVPTAAASIVQGLGVAKSATAIRFAPTGPYKRAS